MHEWLLRNILELLNNGPSVTATANLANIIHKTQTHESEFEWILDTRATNHITSNLICSETPIDCQVNFSFVKMSTGKAAPITPTSTYTLYDEKQLTNVLYVPHFCFNLIFISKSTKYMNCFVYLYPNFCVL